MHTLPQHSESRQIEQPPGDWCFGDASTGTVEHCLNGIILQPNRILLKYWGRLSLKVPPPYTRVCYVRLRTILCGTTKRTAERSNKPRVTAVAAARRSRRLQRHLRAPHRRRNFREKQVAGRRPHGRAGVTNVFHLGPVVHGQVQRHRPRGEVFPGSDVRQPDVPIRPRGHLCVCIAPWRGVHSHRPRRDHHAGRSCVSCLPCGRCYGFTKYSFTCPISQSVATAARSHRTNSKDDNNDNDTRVRAMQHTWLMKSVMPVSTWCWKVTSDSRIRMAKKRRKKHRYATSLWFDANKTQTLA